MKKLIFLLLLLTAVAYPKANGTLIISPITATLDGQTRLINTVFPSQFAFGIEVEHDKLIRPTFHIAPALVVHQDGNVTSLMSAIAGLQVYQRLRMGVGWWLWDSRSGFPLPFETKTVFVNVGIAFEL